VEEKEEKRWRALVLIALSMLSLFKKRFHGNFSLIKLSLIKYEKLKLGDMRWC